jgi:DNA replication protein DnaC
MNNITSLPLLLKKLKLVHFLRDWESSGEEARLKSWSHPSYLHHLSELEVNARHSSKIRRYMKESKLPSGKSLSSFKFQDLPSVNQAKIEAFADNGKWVKDAENLVLLGPSGVGKTHLAAAIGVSLVEQGFRVLFTKTTSLVQKLQASKGTYQLPEAIAKLSRYDLLILDDIGYAKKDELETSVLFELIADRYESGSMIITSNLAFNDWSQIFPDNMMTVAAVDRIVHHSTIIKVSGDSYRRKESEKIINKGV